MNRFISLLDTIRLNRLRRPTLPRFLTFITTFACNARCIMCDSWKKPPQDDLTLTEIERIFDQLPRMDIVRLSGGEPFVRKDIGDIADLVLRKLRPTALHITTNGFLTDRIVRFCENRRKDEPLHLLVSVDGVGDRHNRIRGRARAWDHAVNTLKALADRRKALRIELTVNQTVVDEDGFDDYRQLRDYLEPLGIRNNLIIAYDMSATYSVGETVDAAPKRQGEYSTFGSFDPERLGEFLEEAEKDLKASGFLNRTAKRYYMRGIKNRVVRNVGSPNPPCVALGSHMRLLPDGSVPTCQFNGASAGNLREQSFQEIWSGGRIEALRKWVRNCPGCWAECEILPNAVYTGDLLKETLLPR